MKHCLELKSAFQKLYIGPTKVHYSTLVDNEKNNADGSSSSNKIAEQQKTKTTLREPPLCLYAPCRLQGLRNLLRNCENCPFEEKKALLDHHFADRQNTGPAAYTRSNQGSRIRPTKHKPICDTSLDMSCTVRLADGREIILATGRCDDVADDIIISLKVAKQAAIDGIGKMNKIEPIVPQVTLTNGCTPQYFTMSRTFPACRLTSGREQTCTSEGHISGSRRLLGEGRPHYRSASPETLKGRHTLSFGDESGVARRN